MLVVASAAVATDAQAISIAPVSYLVTFAPVPLSSAPSAAALPPVGAALNAAAARLDARTGVNSVRPLGGGVALATTTLTAAQLRAQPGVASVERDVALTLTDDTAAGEPGVAPVPAPAPTPDPAEPGQWHLRNGGTRLSYGFSGIANADIDATDAWPVSTGRGIVVAVSDTGVALNHVDLAANLWHNVDDTCGNGLDDDHNGYIDDCNGWDFGDRDNDPSPGDEHGTHVAGLLGAARNGKGTVGVAPEVTIMPLKITADRTGILPLSAGVASIMYAADNGANIVNTSWGLLGPSTALRTALLYARSKGVLVVAGAGNNGLLLGGATSFSPGSYSGELDNVISVAATDLADRLATFSNRGAVTLSAPGAYLYSTVPWGWTYKSGTSMASPVVAGAAALVLAHEPDLTAAEVRQRLVDTVDTPLELTQGGAGRLNVGRALGATRTTVARTMPSSTLLPYENNMLTLQLGPAQADDTFQLDLMQPDGTAMTSTAGVGAPSITVGPLVPRTAYFGVLTVTGSTGTVATSFALTALDTPKPPTITKVSATATDALVEFAPGPATGVRIARYDVVVNGTTVSVPATSRTAVVRGLTVDTTYDAVAVAIGADGTRGRSAATSFTTAQASDVPTVTLAPVIRGAAISIGALAAAPGRPAITGYEVKAGPTTVRFAAAADGKASGTVPGLTGGKDTTVNVTVLHGLLNGRRADVGTVTPTPAPLPSGALNPVAAVNGSTVTITWEASSNVLGYVAKLGSSSTYVGAGGLTASLPTPPRAGSYVATITALGTYGNTNVDVPVQVDPVGPGAATNIVAVVNGASTAVTWTAATGWVSSYEIQVGGGRVVTASGSATSTIVATPLVAGPTTVRVVAINPLGRTEATAAITIVAAAPAAPPNLQGVVAGNLYRLTWTATPNEWRTGYAIKRNGTTLFTLPPTATAAAVAMPTTAGTYAFDVVAMNPWGGTPATASLVLAGDPPAAPADGRVTTNGNVLVVSWTPSPGYVTAYQIVRTGPGGVASTYNVPPTASTLSTTLPARGTHTYTITAVNAFGRTSSTVTFTRS